MSNISHAEILNWLENQREDIDIWFSKNLMKWRLRKDRVGLFTGETLSETVREAMMMNKNKQEETSQKQFPKTAFSGY